MSVNTQQIATIVAAVVAALDESRNVTADEVETPMFEAVADDAVAEPAPRTRRTGSNTGTIDVPELPDHITDTVKVDRWILDVPELFVTDRKTTLYKNGEKVGIMPVGERFLKWSYIPKYGAKRTEGDGEKRSRYDYDVTVWEWRYVSDRHIARMASLGVNEQTPGIAKHPHVGRLFKAVFSSGFYLSDKFEPERGDQIWTVVNFRSGVVLDFVWYARGSFYVKRMPNLNQGSDNWNAYLENAKVLNPGQEIKF